MGEEVGENLHYIGCIVARMGHWMLQVGMSQEALDQHNDLSDPQRNTVKRLSSWVPDAIMNRQRAIAALVGS
jgi:hypothetical protein